MHKAAAATGAVEITWPIAAIAMTQGILVTSRGLFVYCRQTQRRRQHNDGGASTGSAGEAQQAPDGGVDDDGGSGAATFTRTISKP